MPATIRSGCRRGTPVLLVLTLSGALLITTGCATNKDLSAAGGPEYEDSISAREYGFVRPAADVWVLDEDRGPKRRASAAAPYAGGPDLWARVRAGMKLAHDADPRIDAKAEAFRRDPQYLVKLSQRARPYLHVVIGEIERRGLPAELALLPHVESRYNPAATSPKAAAGMWQFIPSTGRIMGLRQDQWYDDRRDLLASTRAAMDYLQQLHRRLGGDWELAMAAYNCGPGRVESAQVANRLRGKPTDFWSLDLPSETKNYVPQILAAARLVAEPAKYGLRLPAVPSAPQLELVRTQGPVDLARVAQASGVTIAELQRLNPGLKQGQTAPDGPGRLLVPAGYGKQITAKLASAEVLPAVPPAALGRPVAGRSTPTRPLPVSGEGHVYLVKAGEDLGSIARAQGIEAQTLADFNGLLAREPLLPGQTLRVPGGSAAGPVLTHRVKKGDSLGTIALRYGVTVGELKRWNPLAANEVRAGETIRIYRRAG
jgi:membrane-bound lytic murein transglycosylase D